MSVHLFTALFRLLLFLLVCGTLCGQVSAERGEEGHAPGSTIDLFTKEKVKGAKNPNGDAGAKEFDVKDFYSPIIVSAGNFIVAFAGINRTDNQEKKFYILTNYTEKNKLLDDGNVAKMNENWETQFAVYDKAIQNTQNAEKVVKGLLAVAKEDKVYLLSASYIKKNADDSPDFDFAFYFVDGTVNAKKPKEFKWGESQLTVNDVVVELKNKFQGEQEKDFSFSGSAFLVGGKMVFALVFKNVEKKIIALMQFKNNEGGPEFKYTENIADNCQPFFFPWKTKIMMISANCGTSTNNKIKELSDNWKNWNESIQKFSCHYEFLQNKHNFFTIKNVSKEILLFTDHTQNLQPTGQATKKIYLWMSDGIRFKDIGEIAKENDKVTLASFLFADGKFFSLNQHLKGGSGKEIESVKLTYLKVQSKAIISTINAWKNTDTKISTLCREQKNTSRIPCTTNGPVGFLSGSNDKKNNWEDEYLYEDAKLNSKHKEEKIDNGFTFSGAGAGAKWQIDKEDKKHPYKFTDSGFTLVATVKIDGTVEGNAPNSVLGVGVKQTSGTTANNNIGLLCNAEKK